MVEPRNRHRGRPGKDIQPHRGKTVSHGVRIPVDWMDRIDDMLQVRDDHDDRAGTTVQSNRSTIIREAIRLGLREMAYQTAWRRLHRHPQPDVAWPAVCALVGLEPVAIYEEACRRGIDLPLPPRGLQYPEPSSRWKERLREADERLAAAERRATAAQQTVARLEAQLAGDPEPSHGQIGDSPADPRDFLV